jgi:hypothetical protein
MTNQQQPDKFFREKLQGYQRPAPVAAWDRIESALEKKTNYKFLWWKIAASLLLIAGATYVVWFYDSSSTQKQLTQTKDTTESLSKETKPAEIGNTAELKAESAMTESKPADAPQNPVKKSARREQMKQQEILPALAETSSVEEEQIQQASSPEPVTQPVAVNNTPAVRPARIKMTITSEETNKYLNENALAEATSEEKKPSTLKKLLKKANDLKSNQDPFGDLREKKNEILALNFKNEKRGQNK